METADHDWSDDGPPGDVAVSARGWHRVQLAVLAFIGLCGVLSDADASIPRWVQVTSGLLAIAALALSCTSIFLVASVAWPFPTSTPAHGDAVTAARRLRVGVVLTYLAVAVMALAASSNWWPTPKAGEAGASASVQITDGAGRTACGELVDGPAGRVRLTTAAGPVELATRGLADISPVDSC